MPETTYLKDYAPYPYTLKSIDLLFQIYDGHTHVASTLAITQTDEAPLYLYGEDLEILSLKIDGKDHSDFAVDECGMTLSPPAERTDFTLEIVTKIYPEKNTRLEGLYQSGGTYCTQCEAEGFRRITYFPDRPDVLSIYTTRIEASKDTCPVLLGNGNLIDSGDLPGGRHFATWEDPHKKPCYLFALVAGDLNHIHDTFTTASGRDVDLYIYVRKGDEDQCDHAMQSLKRSMKWDEDVYGLEYDLDIFNIVAVSDFNMGAMENKSLNIFNTALVLAQQETATDTDFIRVESVIAHEYFHNWSGNRVTCRDWFQLSLKEGLTVFRDQEFSSDMHSRAVQRIDDVTHLRRLQFAEDASPLAHPIRPEEYIEINNFYTMTVYEKGAEVIRMFRTLMGETTYRKATDLYFSRHDGQAATCDDWIQCMSEASGLDLEQFKLWYAQAGTPRVGFTGRYDPDAQTYTVTLTQSIPDTAGQKNKQPMHIPVAMGLLGSDGNDLIETQVLHLKESEQSFTFDQITEKPIPSILRAFSAPVILDTDLSDEDYYFLSQHDSDGFNKWESGQILAGRVLHGLIDQLERGEKISAPEDYIQGLLPLLEDALDPESDKALIARALTLPSTESLLQQRKHADPLLIHKARETVLAGIKRIHRKPLEAVYKMMRNDGAFEIYHIAMGRRALRNVVLMLLTATHGTGCAKRAKEHYEHADNMTDRVAALASLASNNNPERDEVFADFYDRYKAYPLVIDKWFSLQASADRSDIIDHLATLSKHPDFNIKNPNRVRSLYAAFAMNNPAGFHKADGSGYAFLRDVIKTLNTINPQIAARLLTPLRSWKSFDLGRQEKMRDALEDILRIPNIAPDIYEIASKSLQD
ncbi:MAG: aminopeptidase N [Alphaproteobacteria bacterium]|nr:aminopeptidase N [Alphaproteobacteria bacterium]|tara:strand:- start:1407 stop:4004 length:2598 start_codon:yes stop_codon:yes gene_type:complete